METGPLSNLLAEEYWSMPPRLQVAARFVLEHPSDVVLMSMREQARRAGVSHSTMVRLATWLGLDSYEDLRAAYAQALRQPGIARGDPDGGEYCTVGGLLVAQIMSLTEPANARQFLEAAAPLAECRRLFCFGMRSAYVVARHFASCMSQTNGHVILLNPTTGAGMDTLHGAGSSAAMLAISFAPYEDTTQSLVQQVLHQGICVVAITDAKISPLVRLANQSIIVPTKWQSRFQSLTPALAATEILAALVAQQSSRGVNASVKRPPAGDVTLISPERSTPQN